MATPLGADAFLEAIGNRRTYYGLNKELSISPDRIQHLVKQAVALVPSSFNSQSNRVMVLFGAEHDKLWDMVHDVLQGIVPAEQFAATAKRLAGFKAAAGSMLFFEDQDTVRAFEAKFPPYAANFGLWAAQSDAMLQFALWTALEAEGLGANLQHYNPLIDERVRDAWEVPASWKLNAQLVFGGRAGAVGAKDVLPADQTTRFCGA
ncbi:hypothetical protein P8C59_006632 [Phyllachora maydis]|uniref:Nitroreductase domain-containing protein n=1 Tax=Phyllachora maydis TaxID=1825666 RepID=A0AAD9I743_9PEZI|nr:hypothetical protein P8C59_006632 [Phyllachora maydis]